MVRKTKKRLHLSLLSACHYEGTPIRGVVVLLNQLSKSSVVSLKSCDE